MLKRLLTAVLILAIFMVFTGTAISAPNNVPHKPFHGFSTVTGPGNATQAIKAMPNYQAMKARRSAPVADNTPNPPKINDNNVDTLACYTLDYFTPMATGAYRIDMYGATGPYPGGEAMSISQDNAAYPTHVCQVDKVYAIIRYASHNGGANMPVRVALYTDNAGQPGTVAYSGTFIIPAKVTGATWYSFTLPSVVTIAGPKYHVVIGNDPSMVAGDSLSLRVSSNNDGGRSNYYDGTGGIWYTMPGAFGAGADYLLAAYSHHCEVYTSCFTENGIKPGYVGLWQVPDVSDGFLGGAECLGFGQRFVSAGPETLSVVEVRHYDYSGALPGVLYSNASTNGLVVELWNDDGTGNVKTTGGPIATYTLAGGPSLFPNTHLLANGWNYLDFSFPTKPVMYGPWHITVRTTSTNEADGMFLLTLNSTTSNPGNTGADVSFSAPATNLWQNTGTSPEWLAAPGGGTEQGFNIVVKMCKDEFYQCQTQVTYVSKSYVWRFDGNNWTKVAQKIKALDVNRISAIRFYTSRATGAGSTPVPSFLFDVYSDPNTGVPGTQIAQYSVTRTPGWTQYVIPGGLQVNGNFYVGYEPRIFPPTTDTLMAVSDNATGGFINGGGLFNDGTGWGTLADWFADPTYTFNIVAEVDFCSIPPTFWACDTLKKDYATAGHDFARTGHSNVSIADAYCNLTLSWKYHDADWGGPAGAPGSSAPIVFGNYVVCGFGSKYQIFDLTTGAVLKTITGGGSPNYISTGNLASTPTIASVTIAGTPTNVLFVAGGDELSVSAYNMDVAGFPQIWSDNYDVSGAKGFPYDLGNTALSNFVVITVGSNQYLCFVDGTPGIWAVNAATGNYVWNRTLPGPPFRGLATDGTNLFVTTCAAPAAVPTGDVYSIKPSNGTINWQLSTAGGLKGDGVVYTAGTYLNETFPNGCATDGGELYTVSSTEHNPPTYPSEGVFYRINTTTGAVLSATASPAVPCYSGNLSGSNCLIDANRVIVMAGSIWASPPLGGVNMAFRRLTGAKEWVTAVGDYNVGGSSNAVRADAALSCEPGNTTDMIVTGSAFGYLSFIQSDNGNEVFNRRIDQLPNTNDGVVNRGAGVAIGKGGQVIWASRYGELYCLTKQVARPRLEIFNYYPSAPTYGALPSVMVDFGAAFTNTGCLPLTGSYTVTDALGSGLGVEHYTGNTSQKAASIANKLTSASEFAWKYAGGMVNINEGSANVSSRSVNRAAAATPPIVNNPGPYAFTLNPGDTGHLVIDMKQNVIARGPHIFYAYFNTNDPDFFLNNVTEPPYVQVTCIGGCITDTSTLHFGASSANWGLISNNGRVANGDWTKALGSWVVDGSTYSADVFQGSYIYGVSKSRIALNTVSWTSGATENDAWVSLQGDPNLCDVNCKPAVTSGISLGAVSTNGLTYTALTGNLVCRSFVDSVQDFGTFSGFASWLWTNSPALFNPDSTMGLKTDSRVIGFVNAPAAFSYLNNVAVDFMKIYPRYGQAVPNWRMGVVVDYDLGSDSANWDGSISAGWDFPLKPARTTGAYGWIKLPYGGCGTSVAPKMVNSKALNEDQALFQKTTATRNNGYLDSVYSFMGLGNGAFSQSAVSGASDQAFHGTFITKNFASGGTDTLTFAVAHFLMPTIANPKVAATFAPMSKLLNQWVGYGRGDVNNDGAINLADIVYLAAYVNAPGVKPGPVPFAHLGDVNGDGLVNAADVAYLISYYFYYGPCPVGKMITY